MNTFEYKDKRANLKSDYEAALRKLDEEYVISNCPYKVGDIFTDHLGTIKIEKIKSGYFGNGPEAVFIGTELKKDGTPKKSGAKRNAFLSNEEKSK